MNAWINAFAEAANMHPDKTAAAVVAAGKSFLVTAGAFASGITVEAMSNGAKTPADVLTYAQVHWLAWAVTNLVAPAWRATSAYKNTTAAIKAT